MLTRQSFAQGRGGLSPDKIFDTVYDRDGNKYALGQIAIDDNIRYAYRDTSGGGGPAFFPLVASTCSSGYFQLYLDSLCGMENFATDATHAARLNVLCQVLHDLSGLIKSRLTLTGNKVNIWVRNPAITGATGTTLGLGTPFYYIPPIPAVTGIVDNTAWLTINSGQDAFANVISPLMVSGGGGTGTSFFHGQISFNFSSVTWHTNLTTAPATGEADLYTTALHECLHMLGFLSHINSVGETFFGPGFKYYSRYDRFLETSSAVSLLAHSGTGCSMYNWSFNSAISPILGTLAPGTSGVCAGSPPDATVCSTAVWYSDGTMNQPVYTPSCFQTGSSLSHFEDECQVPATFSLSPPASNNQYFVMSNAGSVGPYSSTNLACMKRSPTPEERRVLCDIGYKVDTVFGNATNLNYSHYSGGLCGNSIAGVNDGITPTGGFAFSGSATGPNITISSTGASILANDSGATNFECLEVVIGNGTIVGSSGGPTTTAQYDPDPSDFGIVLLRYIPYNVTTGARGNITYIYVNIDDPNCISTACNLVKNPGFEDTPPGAGGLSAASSARCWRSMPTPDLFASDIVATSIWHVPTTYWFLSPTGGHPLSIGANHHFVGMGGNYTVPPLYEHEGVFQTLTSPVMSGTTYTVSFWAKMCNIAPATPTHLLFSVSNIAPVVSLPDLTMGPVPGLTDLCVFPLTQPDDNWHYYTQTVTPTFPTGYNGNSLAIYQAQWLDVPLFPGGNYIAIDDISINPSTAVSTFTPPSPICSTDSTIDLSLYVSIPGPNPVFQWIGASGVVTDSLFEPDSAYNGTLDSATGGLSTISYTYGPPSCRITVYAQVIINHGPGVIHGDSLVCAGSTVTISNDTAGGTWSSSNVTVGTVGSLSGVFTGSSAGTTIVSYTVGSCLATEIFTVVPVPTAITGPSALCSGSVITLSAAAGGTWSSSDISVASVGLTTGIVTGVGVGGTATITYTHPCGIFTHTVTVNSLPATISGPSSVCAGVVVTFTDATIGGTWSSADTTIANIDSLTGIASTATGTTTITYTVSATGCYRTVSFSVNPLPAAITGGPTACLGVSLTLSDATTGGTWSCTPSTTATIGATTGILNASATGAYTVTYTLSTGCYTTTPITVYPVPVITGASAVCEADSILLTEATGGGTWSSGTSAVGTISSGGMFTGISAGTTLITYTFASGCYSTHFVTVHPAPAPIDSAQSICLGGIACFGGPPTGVWTSGSTFVATVGATFGCFNAVGVGVAPITFTDPLGCFVTSTLTVLGLPSAISGPLSLCIGATTTLACAPSGGTWTSSAPLIASIGAGGVVTGSSAGTATITYTRTNGCFRTAVFTVYPTPAITGTFSICEGDTTTLTASPSGGAWTSSAPSVATIGLGSGLVTAVASGTSTITYTSSTGCVNTAVFTVNFLPAPISGSSIVCVGGTTTLTDDTTGGVWINTDANISVNYFGVVTGIVTGTAVITYSLATGCFAVDTLTVDSLPIVAPITGADTVCIGSTITLASSPIGGMWTIDDPSIAYINPATGEVTGITNGSATVTYTVWNSCGFSQRVYTVFSGAPIVAPITGSPGVCSGSTTTLSSTTPGGVWSSSDGSLATIDPVTGVVAGVATGTVVITYEVTNSCGTTQVTTNIVTNLQASITAGFIGACYNLADPPTLQAGSPCIYTCANSDMTYYAQAVAGATFTWTTIGGGISTDMGDSIIAYWPVAGATGMVILHAAFGSCVSDDTMCVQVNETPIAHFTASATSICEGSSISFTDGSTFTSLGTPIFGWTWDFGDGGHSGLQNPTHTFSVAGNYNVVLTVRNSCGCGSKMKIPIVVQPSVGPDITCPSIVCQNETTYYKTSEPCGAASGDYNWDVTGGHIVYGTGYDDSIMVVWDAVDSTGYGKVSLFVPCAACPETTTVKIPVIKMKAKIDGPDEICTGTQYIYKLPLWPGTDYQWGVIGDPSAVVIYREDHQVTVSFSAPGTYTIHCTYQNRVKLCGWDVFKVIKVKDAALMSGSSAVCAGATVTYSLSSGLLGDWNELMGLASVSSATGTNTFACTFNTPGSTIITATGDFCVNPITVVVAQAVGAVDTLIGADTVCPNHYYTYIAGHTVPGTAFIWSVVGGTMSSGGSNDTVTVQWNATGPRQLKVHRESMSGPHCVGTETVWDIEVEDYINGIPGPGYTCANSFNTYGAYYTRGDEYLWTISPDSLGSVISGNHTPNIIVQWNNMALPHTAVLKVTITKCDTTIFDSSLIFVDTALHLTVTAADTVCPALPATFTATPGDSLYVWNFGDGSGIITTTTNAVNHLFPANPSTTYHSYHVSVHSVLGVLTGYGCQPVGMATYDVVVKPGPSAHLDVTHFLLCPSDSAHLHLTTSSNTFTTYIDWSRSGTDLGFHGHDYHTLDTGTYQVYIWGDGCWALSNPIHIDSCMNLSPVSSVPCTDLPDYTLSTTEACGSIGVAVTFAPAPPAAPATVQWQPMTPPISGSGFYPSVSHSLTATANYNTPGTYIFHLTLGNDGCRNDTIIGDTIGLIPDFSYQILCSTGGNDSIFLADNSAYLPYYNIVSVGWYSVYPTGSIGTGTTLHIERPASGSYTVIEEVQYQLIAGGPTYTCTATHVIATPPLPTASFTVASTPTCDQVPVTFTPVTSPAYLGYYWDFGDSSSSLLPFPQRTYTWKGFKGNPNRDTVWLTVTDTIGCTAMDSVHVLVNRNRLDNVLMPDQTVCSNSIPVNLTYTPLGGFPPTPTPISYAWHADGILGVLGTFSVLPVYQSGSYRVTVRDAFRCQKLLPTHPVAVNIVRTPPAVISGAHHYCDGEMISLSAAGGAWPGTTYNWSPPGSGPTYVAGLGVGTFYFQLDLTTIDPFTGYACYDTSAIDTVTVDAMPLPPTVTGPVAVDCNSYHLQLTASYPGSGTYVWNDGTNGHVDDIFEGGLFQVWYTSLTGCTSTTTVNAPTSLQKYMQYFPAGCYDICNEQLPLTLHPPFQMEPINNWAWQMNGSDVLAGSWWMSPYNVTSSGDYTWSLDNGLCALQSDPMHVSQVKCGSCSHLGLFAKLNCDVSSPRKYFIMVSFNNPAPGSAYTLGTDIGPIIPFSGITSSLPTETLFISYTTLDVHATSVTVQIRIVLPDGTVCFEKVTVSQPNPCSWDSEKPIGSNASNGDNPKVHDVMANAMMIFPNPAAKELTISYDFGEGVYQVKGMSVYNEMGVRVRNTTLDNTNGAWKLDVSGWSPGIYIVRMEGDGQSLQTQRVVVIPE